MPPMILEARRVMAAGLGPTPTSGVSCATQRSVFPAHYNRDANTIYSRVQRWGDYVCAARQTYAPASLRQDSPPRSPRCGGRSHSCHGTLAEIVRLFLAPGVES